MRHALNAFVAALTACIFPSAGSGASVALPTIVQALHTVRYPIVLDRGRFTGEGAPRLLSAVEAARYVAVGEDHFTEQVPAFTAALCDAMAPQGLVALALEIGPLAAQLIDPVLRSPDRARKMAAMNAAYPNWIAFLDGRADNDAAAHCVSARGHGPVHLLGLDQEYIGSAGAVFDEILARRLSTKAHAAMRAIRDVELKDAGMAKASGDASQLFLLSDDAKRLDTLVPLMKAGADARAMQAIEELRESAAIYALNNARDPTANTRRATLLKRHLAAAAPPTGKILFKFGDWHIYKGINPLGNRDLGNFIAERADGEGTASLHILVLGAKGVHAAFAGYARAPIRRPFVMTDDHDYAWMKAAVDDQVDGAWTLFDLRALRFRRIADLDKDWERVIKGYDLLVVIPELTATDPF